MRLLLQTVPATKSGFNELHYDSNGTGYIIGLTSLSQQCKEQESTPSPRHSQHEEGETHPNMVEEVESLDSIHRPLIPTEGRGDGTCVPKACSVVPPQYAKETPSPT